MVILGLNLMKKEIDILKPFKMAVGDLHVIFSGLGQNIITFNKWLTQPQKIILIQGFKNS